MKRIFEKPVPSPLLGLALLPTKGWLAMHGPPVFSLGIFSQMRFIVTNKPKYLL